MEKEITYKFKVKVLDADKFNYKEIQKALNNFDAQVKCTISIGSILFIPVGNYPGVKVLRIKKVR